MTRNPTWTISWRRGLGASALLALAIALAAPAIRAAQDGPPGPPGAGRRGPMMHGGPGAEFAAGLRELNLSDAQREQVRTILESHRDEFKATMDQAMTARKALMDATTADTFNEGAVRQASQVVAQAEEESAVLRARVHQEIWKVLTDEQRQEARSLRAEHDQRMQQFRERFKERGQAPRQ